MNAIMNGHRSGPDPFSPPSLIAETAASFGRRPSLIREPEMTAAIDRASLGIDGHRDNRLFYLVVGTIRSAVSSWPDENRKERPSPQDVKAMEKMYRAAVTGLMTQLEQESRIHNQPGERGLPPAVGIAYNDLRVLAHELRESEFGLAHPELANKAERAVHLAWIRLSRRLAR